MVKLTKRDIAIIAGMAGAADFLTEGRFSAPLARALKKAIKKGVVYAVTKPGPAAARLTGGTALRAAGTLARVGKTVALRHPVLTAGAVVYYSYQHRDEIGDLVEQGYEVLQDVAQPERMIISPGYAGRALGKRMVSKANRAVKQGMKLLKEGTKAQTGSPPGKLPAGAFKIATKAAGLANPKTPSVIGKGKSVIKKLARKLRSWW